MRIILCLALLVFSAQALGQAMSSFKDPEEMVAGWYHRHEMETWINKGANETIVRGILRRIESAEGARSNPDLYDTIIEYGSGNWIYEWAQAGEVALAKAERAQGKQAFEAYVEALAYFTTASWPHLGNQHDKQALARARIAYLGAGQSLSKPIQHVEFKVGDQTTRGYLHLPEGGGPFPLLIYTHGSDVTKEDSLSLFVNELDRLGIAMLAVDLTGIGEASHIPLTRGSDVVLVAAKRYAHNLPMINQAQVFLAGASFGGNAAAKYWLTQTAAGVISMCGPLHKPFVAPPEVFDQLPALTIDGLKSRLGILGASNQKLNEVAPHLSLKRQGSSQQKIDTPLLIFTTNQDPVAPLEDLEILESRAEHVDKLVLDMIGHCPPRWIREPIFARWLRDRLH